MNIVSFNNMSLKKEKINENSLDKLLKKYYFEVSELKDLFSLEQVLLKKENNLENIEKAFYEHYKGKFELLLKNDINLKSDIEDLIYRVMKLLNENGILSEIMKNAQLFWNSFYINDKEFVIKTYDLLKAEIDLFDYVEDKCKVILY